MLWHSLYFTHRKCYHPRQSKDYYGPQELHSTRRGDSDVYCIPFKTTAIRWPNSRHSDAALSVVTHHNWKMLNTLWFCLACWFHPPQWIFVPATTIQTRAPPRAALLYSSLHKNNTNQIPFVERILEHLDNFTTGLIVLGGDFNCALDPLLDTFNSSTQHSYAALRRLKKTLHQHQLIDVWRLSNPEGKDNSFYSHVHSSYSRIDYFFLKHHQLSCLRHTAK